MRRVLLFPAFIGADFWASSRGLPAAGRRSIETLVARIGATLTPVALFSIGLQFTLHLDRSRLGAAALALGWKLALRPC